MKSISQYLFEVSRATANKAAKAAASEIKKLMQKLVDSRFKDQDIIAKLEKRARQEDLFKDYVKNIDNEAKNIAGNEINTVINKWKEGIVIEENKITYLPMFDISQYGGKMLLWVVVLKPNYIKKSASALTKLGLSIDDAANIDEKIKELNDAIVADFKSLKCVKSVSDLNQSKQGTLCFKCELNKAAGQAARI